MESDPGEIPRAEFSPVQQGWNWFAFSCASCPTCSPAGDAEGAELCDHTRSDLIQLTGGEAPAAETTLERIPGWMRGAIRVWKLPCGRTEVLFSMEFADCSLHWRD